MEIHWTLANKTVIFTDRVEFSKGLTVRISYRLYLINFCQLEFNVGLNLIYCVIRPWFMEVSRPVCNLSGNNIDFSVLVISIRSYLQEFNVSCKMYNAVDLECRYIYITWTSKVSLVFYLFIIIKNWRRIHGSICCYACVESVFYAPKGRLTITAPSSCDSIGLYELFHITHVFENR